MTDLTAILAEFGVAVKASEHRIGPRETRADRTLAKILSDHGEGHLRLVLSTILESENNATELVAPTIQAVSDLILAHPAWVDRASEWLETFDAISLGSLRQAVKGNRSAVPIREAMASALYLRLRDRFGEPAPQKDLFG